MFRKLTVSHALIFLALCGPRDESQQAFAEEIDFARDVQPILSDNCFTCHGPDQDARQADLRLDTENGLLQSGIVVPGEPDQSELIRRLITDDADEHMPPTDSNLVVHRKEISQIRQWIEEGARWSRHWAYQPLIRPSVPRGAPVASVHNAIDSFVQSNLRDNKMSPATEASRERLIRRVTLDLTGLPPTVAELESFLGDTSPNAYQIVVDRLLASAAFGERMAWPWLDAARYADSNGFQGDRDRTMWPWRDWVVDAVNQNMPFDEFTILQLAGDQLPSASDAERLATGFCRNHMINGEGGRIPAENRVEYIFDQIETVGTIWLGTTMQCCRCHDHKFDPVSQDEYFKLFAFFNQTPVNGGGGDPQTAPVIAVPNRLEQLDIEQWTAAVHDSVASLKLFESQQVNLIASLAAESDNKKDISEAIRRPPFERSANELKELEQLAESKLPEYSRLLKSLRESKEQRNKIVRSIPKVMVMEDMPLEKHRKTHVLNRGLYNKPLHEVIAGTPDSLPPINVAGSVPNRLDLANWLIDEDNPLTARVTVNRIWQTFFGKGLVETAEDFGMQSKRPSHPKLLDWLASEYIRSEWDTKHIVRLIVTSATYRQTSSNLQSTSLDPANRLLARGPRHRMPAWMIRDQALALSGLLVHDLGGPPIKPYQPKGVWADATFGNKRYDSDHGESLYRRSIYVFWRRIVGPTMFFDGGKRQTCEVKVPRTNTPLHALATLNDVTYVEAARAMAERAFHAAPANDAAQIEFTFRLATARTPSDAERSRLQKRLFLLTEHFQSHPKAAAELLELGESSRDESLSASQHAALTCVCLLILNLDETLTN